MRTTLRPLVAGIVGVLLIGTCVGGASGHAEPSYNPFTATRGLYIDPENPAWRWARANPGDPRHAEIAEHIAHVPQARWIGPGGENGYAAAYVSAAAEANLLPVLVAYAIPNRDCGGASSGGMPDADSYIAWAQRLAWSIGDRPAVLILEPDATLSCFDSERARALRGAIDALAAYAPRTWVYLDAGDGRWNQPATIAARMRQVGTHGLRGFAVNVSNYNIRETIEKFVAGMGEQGIALPFVWDTSRNGAGPDATGTWCNPAGRRLGPAPRTGGAEGADASLWVKHPGSSDGPCGAYPDTQSGQFSPVIASNLIHGR